jgi:hypothetical protein
MEKNGLYKTFYCNNINSIFEEINYINDKMDNYV